MVLWENVVLSSQLITFVSFRLFCKRYIDIDMFNLVNLPLDFFELDVDEVSLQIKNVLKQLKLLSEQNKVKLSPELSNGSIDEIIDDGLKNLNIYHLKKPLYIKDNLFRSQDIKVLYFYANRLSGYQLDDYIMNHTKAKSLRMVETAI